MAYSVGVMTVKDFAAWKATFDGAAEQRRATGQREHQILRSADDPNQFLIVVKWDSLDSARAFFSSDWLAQSEESAGVLKTENAFFAEDMESGSV